MIIVVMGVAGSGKTTIGTLLAAALGCPFLEGDSLHSASNVEKMRHGIPLDDRDRLPWLEAVHARMREAFEQHSDLVVACSALKAAYRAVLSGGIAVTWVYLKGDFSMLDRRLRRRSGHFMKADLLPSQLDALEEPDDAIVVDADCLPADQVKQIVECLPRSGGLREVDQSPKRQH